LQHGSSDELCCAGCLEYSISYLPKSGFAIFSLATRGKVLLADAILSMGVLNASTPVLIAIVGFGWVMWLLERRLNKDQFPTPSAGVCACCSNAAACICPSHAFPACAQTLALSPWLRLGSEVRDVLA
jgi:hypothetical protein